VKGAFTSAIQSKKGYFEVADGGTIFFDEIGTIGPETQIKLLRVIQEKEFIPLGATEPVRVDVRILAATNADLRELVKQGKFREDLFYRLNVVPIRLPPLRERTEDIADLARHFLERARADGLPAKTLDQAAVEALRGYRWPGNVRELENLIRRMCALYAEEGITARIIERELKDETERAAPGEGPVSLGALVERRLAADFASHPDRLPPRGLYDRVIEEVEAPLIRLTLAATRGNQIRAAEILGLNRNTLRKKIHDLGLQPTRTKA